MGSARQLEDDLWVVDTLHLGEPGVIAAYLLVGSGGLGLIDVGPAATVRQVIAGIEAAGFAVGDLQHLVLTHVHLDHAGAAGALAQFAPQARIYVHPLGARHLVDPAKLVASAQRIYGSEMNRLWGTMTAVPAARLHVLGDGDQLRVGSRTLRALHTPGHAVHHIAYHDVARQALFAGDVAGVALEGIKFVRPPTPPPDLNLEDWSQSLSRLRALELTRLYLPHFGPVARVKAHLSELERRLYEWGEFVLARMRAGKDTDAIVSDLAAASQAELRLQTGGTEASMSEASMSEASMSEASMSEASMSEASMARRYELATNYRMTVQGYERYYRTIHPDRLQS